MDILYLEDDALLAQSVIDELEDASYSVTWVQESDEVIDLTFLTRFKLYLFDVNVPGMNGFELLKSLREAGDRTPALFITSRNQIEDIKQGFKVGADDYIKKPFDLNELLIRIEAKIETSSALYLSKDFSIDAQSLTITCKNSSQVIPAKEFAILSYLCSHQDQLISAETMIDELYEDTPISVATFRTYIKNLKRHIEGCAVVENVKGVGYRLRVL